MSMTREEAIEYAESKKMRLEALVYNDDCKYGNYAMYSGELSFVNAALSALRPVSRERVERMFRGCEVCKGAKYVTGSVSAVAPHDDQHEIETDAEGDFDFCPVCGRPLTDEAVEMVVRRLEELHENP